MGTEDLSGAIRGLMEDSVGSLLDLHLPKHAAAADWDLQALTDAVLRDFNVRVDPQSWLTQEPQLEEQVLRERVVRAVNEAYDAKVARIGAPIMRHVEKDVMLRMLDQHWREHLAAMDYLRQGIHLRGYAQKDYRFEFKREAFELFSAMLDRIKFETSSRPRARRPPRSAPPARSSRPQSRPGCAPPPRAPPRRVPARARRRRR